MNLKEIFIEQLRVEQPLGKVEKLKLPSLTKNEIQMLKSADFFSIEIYVSFCKSLFL